MLAFKGRKKANLLVEARYPVKKMLKLWDKRKKPTNTLGGTCLDPVWALEYRPFQRLQDGVQTIIVLCPSQEEPRPGLEVVKDQLPVHSEAGGFGKYAEMTNI